MKGTIKTDEETVTFYAREERTASKFKAGSKNGAEYFSGRIYLPKEWIGKRVLCLLLDEPDADDSKK